MKFIFIEKNIFCKNDSEKTYSILQQTNVFCGINHRRLKIEDRRKNRTTLA